MQLGYAHNFDKIEPSFFTDARRKDTSDYIIGISQLLTPKTVASVNFTYGTDSGYLSDPYKNVRFDGWLPQTFIFAEKRPHVRDREIMLATLTQFIDPLNASVELSYRFYHDTFNINAHTAALTWYQKIGRYLVVQPSFRYYEQDEAFFYTIGVPGFTPNDGDPARPTYYSADYRLSHLESYTYGVQALVRVRDWLGIDLGYQRYEMYGLDNVTSSTAYPNANVFSAGFRLWF